MQLLYVLYQRRPYMSCTVISEEISLLNMKHMNFKNLQTLTSIQL